MMPDPFVSKYRLALAGAAALVPAVAASYALRRWAGGILLPEVVAQYVIEQAPGLVTRWAIGWLGKAAKPLGFLLAFAGFFLVASAFARYYGRIRDLLPGESPAAKGLGFTLITLLMTLVLLGFVGVTAPGLFGSSEFGPSLISVLLFNLLFGLALAYVSRALFPLAAEREEKIQPKMTRRLFLAGTGVFVASVALIGAISRDLLDYIGTGVGTLPGRLPAFFTSNTEFYVVQKEVGAPRVEADDWQLRIDGLVERPFTLNYAELQTLSREERVVTLECIDNNVGGPLISNALWRGVALRTLLERAGVRAGAGEVVVRAVGGYADSLTLERAFDPDIILAVEMNGERLPRSHGFPARLVTPGLYGIKNVKWVERIEVRAEDFKGFWQQRGWTDDGTIKTMSKFSLPVAGARLSVGQSFNLGGVAFAGNRGVGKVEVSVDGGREWREAQLSNDPAPSAHSWAIWTLDWTPAREGAYTLIVRATDRAGLLQTAAEQGVFPDGASGYHRLRVTVERAA